MSDKDFQVPGWDGAARTWRRYTRKVAWYFRATPVSKRRYVATKLLAKLSEAARLLAMSWSDMSLDDYNGTKTLLQRLASSPLVRQSIPNASAICAQYFEFKRGAHEPTTAFLVRESLGFAEFVESLVRLAEQKRGIRPEDGDFGLPPEEYEQDDDSTYAAWQYWQEDDWATAEVALMELVHRQMDVLEEEKKPRRSPYKSQPASKTRETSPAQSWDMVPTATPTKTKESTLEDELCQYLETTELQQLTASSKIAEQQPGSQVLRHFRDWPQPSKGNYELFILTLEAFDGQLRSTSTSSSSASLVLNAVHQVVSLDRAENYASPEKRELLAGYRRRERRMLWMMVRFSEETVEEDPTTDIYFDWPYPCEGWKEAPLIHLADFLNKLGLDWLPCRIDGCRYGLREKSGEGSSKIAVLLKTYPGLSMQAESADEVIRALSLGRLAHYPKFNQFTVEQNIFLHFPPEKEPWSHGIVEAAIQDVKHVASANQKEALDNLPEVTLALATSALNSTEYTAGFSSHQWAFGAKYSINDEDARMWQGVAPHLDFINASKARLAAEEIARQSRARRVLSKLADTTVKQPLRQYKITDLVMVWRKVQVGDQHQGSRGGHKNSSRRQSDFIMNCMTSDEDPSSWKTLEDLLPHRSYDDVTSEVPGADELELPGLPEEPDETTYAPIRRAIGKSTLGPSDYKKVHRSTWIGLGPRSTTPAKYLPDPVPRPEPGGSSSSAKLSPPEGLEEYTPSSGGEDANSYENKKRSDDGAPVTEPETKKPRHEDYDLGWVEALQAEAMEEITHEDIFNVLQVYDGDCLSIEIEINVASHTQKRNFLHNPIAYLTKKLNSAEVHLKHLSDAERLLFVRAKAKEVSSFLKNQVVVYAYRKPFLKRGQRKKKKKHRNDFKRANVSEEVKALLVQKVSDEEFHGKISVEQTLQIIYVRHGRSNLDDEITEIFGQQQKGSDGQELKISFSQYLALGSDELRWAQEHLSNTSLVSNHRLFMGDTNDLSIALGRFGYSAKQLPPPANIYQHRDAMVNEVRKNLAEGELALQQQLNRQQEQLEELQTQQRTRFKLALDCQVKADEYALSKRHNEQLMQLQQQAQARRAQLEQQATSLVLEFQQRKLQEEFFLQQKEIHRQHQEEQQRLGSELQKLGCSGAQALTLLGPQFFKVSRQAKESPSSLTLSHIPSFTTPKAASLTTRPSFQVFQSHVGCGCDSRTSCWKHATTGGNESVILMGRSRLEKTRGRMRCPFFQTK
ncbi:unnamed protein product, partial [Durusdinium trenchii]